MLSSVGHLGVQPLQVRSFAQAPAMEKAIFQFF